MIVQALSIAPRQKGLSTLVHLMDLFFSCAKATTLINVCQGYDIIKHNHIIGATTI